MQLAIRKIILWPKDQTLAPKIIPFELGKINIITGESGTGKSTLTWIIDYCLGSDKCSIPVGLIRELTEWFGLHLKLANTEMIVARRNPGDQQTTTDLFWVEGLEVNVPPIVQRNARVDDLKNRFNQIGNLPSLDFSTDDQVGYGGRPSFRDMASFNFQPQHIVANPYTLFYKADTTEHREKLKIIFPLVLGAIDAGTLAKQRELKDTEQEYERLRRQLDARLKAAQAWEAEVESYFLQARGLGLFPSDTPAPAPNWTIDNYVRELQKVPQSVRVTDIPELQEGTNELAATDFARVANEEDQLAQEVGMVRRRLEKIEQLVSSVGEYGTDLTTQGDRLESVGWFEQKITNTHQCPVCSAMHNEENPRLVELQVLAREMKMLTTAVRQAPARLDEELAALRVETREKEGLLSKARQKRKLLESETAALAGQRQRVRQIYLFVGRVEQALANVTASRSNDDLQQRANALNDRIATLRREIDPRNQRDRMQAAIRTVSARIATYAEKLQLEHAAENVQLNVRDLTIQFSPLSGRTDFLWEVGSGQNWVGYHIAGLLALHEHFLSIPETSVPRFLVIDQPSQVYFPEAWPVADEVPMTDQKADRSKDIEGVHRIFVTIASFFEKVDANFQVIVTEHAGPITWEGVPYVHVVGNWRQGHDEFLIPADWQSEQS